MRGNRAFHADCNSAAAHIRSYRNGTPLGANKESLMAAYQGIDAALAEIRHYASDRMTPPPYERMRRVAELVAQLLHAYYGELALGGHTPERLIDFLLRQKETMGDLVVLRGTSVGVARLSETVKFLEFLGRKMKTPHDGATLPAA